MLTLLTSQYAPLVTTSFVVGPKNGFYPLFIDVQYINLKLFSLAITLNPWAFT